MTFKTTISTVLLSLAFVFHARADSPASVPTNSLAFHLQSLGRTPTIEEREIIETALRLMQLHQVRSDYPLKSINHDTAKREWVLDFDGSHPKPNVFVTDSKFLLFLQAKDSSYIEVRWAGTNWRTRHPAERKTR